MAEIRIVRKDAGRRRLLWLVPLLVLLAVVPWFVMRQRAASVAAVDTTTIAEAAGAVDTAAAQPATPAAPDPAAALDTFTSFVAAGQPDMADTSQIRYASDGLLRLADAMEAIVAPRATETFTAAIGIMRQQATQLPVATGIEPTYMEIAKPAFSAATTALTELQRARGAGDVTPAVAMAGTIGSRGSLRPQREKIQNFFDQTATALQTVLRTPGITPSPDPAVRSRQMDSLRRGDSLRMERVRQAGGGSSMADRETRIAPLSEMTQFKVSSDDPDPRGWDVVASDGRTIGTVKDLLVDREAMRVRYLEVELAGEARRTLLPIGTAQLDDETDRVLFHQLTPDELQSLPAYDYAAFTREYEESVVTRFGPGGGGAIGKWSYGDARFDADAFYKKRRNRYGGMARGEKLDAPLTRAEENPAALAEAEALVVGTQRKGEDRRASDDRRDGAR